jgi:hypothetical protein
MPCEPCCKAAESAVLLFAVARVMVDVALGLAHWTQPSCLRDELTCGTVQIIRNDWIYKASS